MLTALEREMLEALRGAVPQLDENYRWHRDMQSHASKVTLAHNALSDARAVIAKAEAADRERPTIEVLAQRVAEDDRNPYGQVLR